MLPPGCDERSARAAFTWLIEPADPLLGALIRLTSPAQALTCIQAGHIPAGTAEMLDQPPGRLRATLDRWRTRLSQIPDPGNQARYEDDGIRLLCLGDPEWPPGLDDLGDGRPYALWVRGDLNLSTGCAEAVAIVGSRAATGYGAHVASDVVAEPLVVAGRVGRHLVPDVLDRGRHQVF